MTIGRRRRDVAGRWRLAWAAGLAPTLLAAGLASSARAADGALAPWPDRPVTAAASSGSEAVPSPSAETPRTVATRGWRVVGLPDGKAPLTAMRVQALDGERVLDLRADASYGTWVHDLPPGTAAGMLRWRWRLLAPNAQADLRQKAGDDSPLKVCASFALPLSAVPFMERQMLRLARSVSGQDLPAATVCYVWDSRLAAGTVLDNAYSRRLRWIVLRGPQTPLGEWQSEQRDLKADFLSTFGDEANAAPPLQAVVVGADADNTGGRSQAQVGVVQLLTAPSR